MDAVCGGGGASPGGVDLSVLRTVIKRSSVTSTSPSGIPARQSRVPVFLDVRPVVG